MKKPPKITDKQYMDALERSRLYARQEMAYDILEKVYEGDVEDAKALTERRRIIRIIANLI